MRLLVLDGSRVLHSLIRRLAPSEVELEWAQTFEQAAENLERRPPDAAIINLTPSALPWSQLQTLCEAREPSIPVLFESCVYSSPAEAGLDGLGRSSAFLAKPYHVTELAGEIERLFLLAGEEVAATAVHHLAAGAQDA